KSLRYATSDAPRITIRHLLTHSGGFPEDNPWGDQQLAATDDEMAAMMRAGIPFSTAPGTAYEYSNYGFAILGRIVARVSGMPYARYLDERVLRPLGMTSTTLSPAAVPPSRLAQGYRWEDERWKLEPQLPDGAFGPMGGMLTSVRASCWSPQGLSSGNPSAWDSRCRIVIFGESVVGYVSPASSGTYRSAGSSSDSCPSSRSLRIAIAVKLLVIDAMRNTELVSTGDRVARSRNPVTPTCASFPSMITPQAAPGMCSRVAKSRNNRSIAGMALIRRSTRESDGCCATRAADGRSSRAAAIAECLMPPCYRAPGSLSRNTDQAEQAEYTEGCCGNNLRSRGEVG
ncbi:MAG TPA: serine hydrolase domain-containing protein, partial [Gemmatimonadaceae bacterium]|nr:serine hydrolase domain-containing protein [Gemmatimonadaceae bacterium]